MEEQPRHTPNQPTDIDESQLPDSLKGRLKVQIINKVPPGDGSPWKDPPTSYTQLTVFCGENKDIEVTVDYLYYLSTLVFERNNDLWYLVHTWTRTWREGSKSSSVFINLRTGENHETSSFSLWRGHLSISKDGNLILIDAGITASSARQINVIDITHLPEIELLHYEENWISDYCVKFAENRQDVVFEYLFTDQMFKYFYEGDKSQDLTETTWYHTPTKEVVIIRTKDYEREYAGSDNFQNNIKLEESKYGVDIGENKMKIISEIVKDYKEEESDNESY